MDESKPQFCYHNCFCNCKACASVLNVEYSSPRAIKTSYLHHTFHDIIKVGKRVRLASFPEKQGVLRWIGTLNDKEMNPSIYAGVELDEIDDRFPAIHGTLNGKRIFNCKPGHGALVRITEIREMPPFPKVPPLSGNSMFPSYEEIKTNRKLREIKLNACRTQSRSSNPEESSRIYDRLAGRSCLDISSDNFTRARSSGDISKERLADYKNEWSTNRSGIHAEKMLETLLKLQKAYNEGLKLAKTINYDRDSTIDSSNYSSSTAAI